MKRLVILGCLVLAACGGGPRALSDVESARLAHVRVGNYSARYSAVEARVPTGGGVLLLSGRVDFVGRVGSVSWRTEGRSDAASAGELQWGAELVAVRSGGDWQLRPLQQGAELDTVLVLLTGLGAENPDAVRDARWVRSDSVGGVDVDVIDNGGRLVYWVDRDGRLVRLDARIGDRSESATVTFHLGGGAFDVLPDLR
nr:hypothetical protein [Kibdelosporangium sp. MJ126-NF4]CEL15670.1 hypothetical protein [Kibdelosporangium sp. MJ126-NF4]CTQ93595.1 hypothetical protein [Kibdelosporangium sp. MJ126-NF4]